MFFVGFLFVKHIDETGMVMIFFLYLLMVSVYLLMVLYVMGSAISFWLTERAVTCIDIWPCVYDCFPYLFILCTTSTLLTTSILFILMLLNWHTPNSLTLCALIWMRFTIFCPTWWKIQAQSPISYLFFSTCCSLGMTTISGECNFSK